MSGDIRRELSLGHNEIRGGRKKEGTFRKERLFASSLQHAFEVPGRAVPGLAGSGRVSLRI